MKLKAALQFLLFILSVTLAPLLFYDNLLRSSWEDALSNFLSEGSNWLSDNDLSENPDQIEVSGPDPSQGDERDYGVLTLLYLAFLALALLIAYLVSLWELRKAARQAQSKDDDLTALKEKYERDLQAFSIVEAAEGDDFGEIQRKFVRYVRSAADSQSKSVAVLGFSFKAFWPNVMEGEILCPSPGDPSSCASAGWTFDLYYTSPRFVSSPGVDQLFGGNWKVDAQEKEFEMKHWLASPKNLEFLKKHSINLKITPHRVVPFIHGKRWGDGTWYFHIARWAKDGKDGPDHQLGSFGEDGAWGLRYPWATTFHEVLDANLISTRAKWYRQLLESWFEKYRTCSEPPLFDTETEPYLDDSFQYLDKMSDTTFHGGAALEGLSVDKFSYWAEGNFEQIHSAIIEQIEEIRAKKEKPTAIDIGSGLGRDAHALAKKGFMVTAVEPWGQALEESKRLNDHKNIQWLSAHLPSVELPDGSSQRFDLVLLSASWMYLPKHLRRLAMKRIFALTAAGGLTAISIRRPVATEHGHYEATSTEARLLASEQGYVLIYDRRHEDPFEDRRGKVYWDYLVFQRA